MREAQKTLDLRAFAQIGFLGRDGIEKAVRQLGPDNVDELLRRVQKIASEEKMDEEE